jgi:hypothetical protein
MIDPRQAELIRRGGIDPIRVDTRPFGEIIDDEIPYARWERERKRRKNAKA